MVKQIICVSFRRKSEDDTPDQAAECRAVSKFQFVCKNINTVEEMAHWNTFLFYRYASTILYLCEHVSEDFSSFSFVEETQG